MLWHAIVRDAIPCSFPGARSRSKSMASAQEAMIREMPGVIASAKGPERILLAFIMARVLPWGVE